MKKVKLSHHIYKILTTLSQNNRLNSEIIYDLTPNFQFHVLYLPDAVNTLRKILKNNGELLEKLGHDQINFNVFGSGDKEKDAPTSILNIVINIVDSSTPMKGEPTLNFSRQNKLVNFMNFFFSHSNFN